MPIPLIQNIASNNFTDDNMDQLINKEKSYDTFYLAEQMRQNIPLLNKEQPLIYNEIIQAANNSSGCFFVNDPAGTGKIFLYNTLLADIRSHGNIAIAIASSGITALLMNGGRTAYSYLKFHLKLMNFQHVEFLIIVN